MLSHIIALDLRLQAFTPSDHLLLPSPPQFLNQAPPGAQQLTLPDFRNIPHLRHVITRWPAEVIDGVLVIGGVLTDVLVGVLAMSSRLGVGRRDAYPCGG